MNKILLALMFMNSIIICSSKNPLSMGMTLLIQTLIITLMSGLMSFNFWYMYILFIIMLGGMLVLFIYVSSVTSNIKFIFNKNFIIMYVSLTILLTILMNFYSKNYLSYNSDMTNMLNIELEKNFMLKMSLNKLYNTPTNWIMILMINYLLLTLFIVVKMTNIKLGALRKSF